MLLLYTIGLLKEKKIIYSIALGIFCIILFYLFFVNKILNANQKILLTILIISQATASIGEAIIIKQGKEKLIFWINILYFIAYFVIHYFGCLTRLNLTNILILLCLANAIKTIVLFVYKKTVKFLRLGD